MKETQRQELREIVEKMRWTAYANRNTNPYLANRIAAFARDIKSTIDDKSQLQ